MRLPWKRSDTDPIEQKSMDVMPEWAWEMAQSLNALSGGQQGLERAVGLPAVLAVIRLLSHAAGMVPLNVVRGEEGQLREKAFDTWQHRLLRKRPGPPPQTPFAFKADLAANFAGRGNAYVRKLKPSTLRPRLTGPTPRVTELMSLNAAKVKPGRAPTGDVIYHDSTGTVPVTRSTGEVIQIRSFSSTDGLEGVSPLTACRLMVEAGLSRQQFEQAHLRNGIFPGVGITFPSSVDEAQGERWLKFIEKQHQGAHRAGKTIIVGGGAALVPIPISLQDAQFAEVTRLTIVQACAIYQIPVRLFVDNASGGSTRDADADWRHLLTFGLGPFFSVAAEAFSLDEDLFDSVADGEDLTVTSEPDALMKLNPEVQANVDHLNIQDGVRLVDEVRAEKGYGPLPPVPEDWTQHPGMIPQITPVGGSPNPTVDTGDPTPDPQP